jgi:hypothetical protein
VALPLATRAPDFNSSTPSSPRFGFSVVGGRYVLLVFLPPSSSARDVALEATPVTRGRRFATLPFLYDEAGARVRAEHEARLATPEDPAA